MNGHPSTSPHRPRAVAVAPAAATWESLRYAGEQGTKAVFFCLRPGTNVQVRVEYDWGTRVATSHPDTPELTALAEFAAMVLREHAELRALRASPSLLAGLRDEIARRAEASPTNERLRARLAACEIEVRKREALGPTLAAAAQLPDGPARTQAVRALTRAELFGE